MRRLVERPGSLQVAVDEVGAVVVEEGARGAGGVGAEQEESNHQRPR